MLSYIYIALICKDSNFRRKDEKLLTWSTCINLLEAVVEEVSCQLKYLLQTFRVCNTLILRVLSKLIDSGGLPKVKLGGSILEGRT